MSGTSIRRAVLATAIAASLVTAAPALAATTYSGNGTTDPAVSVVVKVKGKNFPIVRSVTVGQVSYTCTDGSSFTAPEAFTVGELEVNDKGKFKFSGEADDGSASLKLSGKLSGNGKEISGSFTEIRDQPGGVSCTSGKQLWEAKRA